MAEVFGVVTGALSVLTLFNSCLDGFKYIQLGRHFADDYETCQLRLDIAGMRLGRWGAAAQIAEKPEFASPTPTDRSTQLARAVLEKIELLFLSAQQKSKHYDQVQAVGVEDRLKDGQNHQGQGLVAVLDEGRMEPVRRALHGRLRDITHKRKKQTSFCKKAAWALYDGQSLKDIVDSITTFVDDLEKLFPAEDAARRTLAAFEIKDMDDFALVALYEAAQGVDQTLAEAVNHERSSGRKAVEAAETAAAEARGQNLVRNIDLEDDCRILVGNMTTTAGLGGCEVLVQEQTLNSVMTLTAKGRSRVQVGNAIGDAGFWD